LERKEKTIYIGWNPQISLKRDVLRLSEMLKNPNLANEESTQDPYPVARWISLWANWKRDVSETFLMHFVQISLKRDEVASSEMLCFDERNRREMKARCPGCSLPESRLSEIISLKQDHLSSGARWKRAKSEIQWSSLSESRLSELMSLQAKFAWLRWILGPCLSTSCTNWGE